MEYRYLCARHRHAVQCDTILAEQLFEGAKSHGEKAYRNSNWSLARAFLGSAFDIAGMQIAKKRSVLTMLSADVYVEVGEKLSDVLFILGLFDEAEVCLQSLSSFLYKAWNNSKSGSERATHIFMQLQRVSARLEALDDSATSNTQSAIKAKALTSARLH